MKVLFKYVSVLLMIVIISCNNKNKDKSQDNNNSTTKKDNFSAQIDSLIRTTSPRTFNGVILITQNGETKYTKVHGNSNFKNKTPITINDNFRIQSNSKQITAALILKEVENGKIDLKSPIRKYLPSLKQNWADTVTVHHLLNMSSGIIAVDQPLIFKPGTDYKYSNPAYGLLGKILENITGKKYVEIANNLFEQLGMHNSYCYEMGKPNEGLINGYRVSNNEVNYVEFNNPDRTEAGWKAFIPAGGIISNVKDLNNWDIKLHNGKILKPETYKLMTNYNITGQHDAFGNKKIGYGYGVRIDDNTPVTTIGHAGRGLGFASIKFYVPDKDVNVIVLENVYNEDASIVYHFETKIREIVLNSSLLK